MKLLQSHEDYINGILEDLFLNVLDIEKNLMEWSKKVYHPFDNYEDWVKYGDTFIKLEIKDNGKNT